MKKLKILNVIRISTSLIVVIYFYFVGAYVSFAHTLEGVIQLPFYTMPLALGLIWGIDWVFEISKRSEINERKRDV